MTLTEKLLNTNLFDDNGYFKSYIALVEANKNTKKQKFKTQAHHIIPAVACDMYNINKNTNDNLVNLLYKDHVLAHYYLALCSKNILFKFKMICAINFILGKAKQVKLNSDELRSFTLNLDKYQELYEEYKKYFAEQISKKNLGHTTSEECKRKISENNKGRVYVYRDGVVRALHKEEVQLFLDNGWQLGNIKCQNRKTCKGYTVVNKNGIEKYIPKEKLDQFILEGWIPGRSKNHIAATKIGTQKYYDGLSKEEKIKKYGVNKGKTHSTSEETKLKNSQARKGKKQPESQKLKTSINKKGTIHMTNGEKDIMIKEEREQEFLDKGFYRGRSKNRKGGR